MFHLDEKTDRVNLQPIKVGERIKLDPRLILNPGSVGQPRDRDPRAAYAIYDSTAKTWEPRRATYNIPEVQQRIRDVGLPEKHAVRIAEGGDPPPLPLPNSCSMNLAECPDRAWG
jgi:diadenosine tetraphosphatase ApaH/serine/threonine PP2A family protein phosphatase